MKALEKKETEVVQSNLQTAEDKKSESTEEKDVWEMKVTSTLGTVGIKKDGTLWRWNNNSTPVQVNVNDWVGASDVQINRGFAIINRKGYDRPWYLRDGILMQSPQLWKDLNGHKAVETSELGYTVALRDDDTLWFFCPEDPLDWRNPKRNCCSNKIKDWVEIAIFGHRAVATKKNGDLWVLVWDDLKNRIVLKLVNRKFICELGEEICGDAIRLFNDVMSCG